MSRQQTVRHQSRQHIRPSQDASKSSKVPAKPRQYPSPQPILLLQRYTPLLWLLALAILVGSATAAVMSILDPDASVPYDISLTDSAPAHESSTSLSPRIEASPVPQPAAEPTTALPQPQRPPSQKQQTETAFPLSAGGAILLSCAAGCFLLSQWLKPDSSRRGTRRPRASQQSNQMQAPSPHPLQVPATPQIQSLPPAVQPSFVVLRPQPHQQEPPAKPAANVSVTVMPADQDHPLDWDEPSLADSLDLRQRRPLSYWLYR
jgi:hypothetical protein